MRRLVGLLLLLLCAACEEAGAPTRFRSDPSPPPGTAPRGSADDRARLAIPGPKPTSALLHRGQERYAIFCVPCHGGAGYGDGVVIRRGFPSPPSFHDAALAGIAPSRIVDVITNGSGRMLPLAEQIPPSDRWAISWYVKALQRSQAAGARDEAP